MLDHLVRVTRRCEKIGQLKKIVKTVSKPKNGQLIVLFVKNIQLEMTATVVGQVHQ